MKQEMLLEARKLNWVLKKGIKGKAHFFNICNILSEIINANVYILNKKGNVLGYHFIICDNSLTDLTTKENNSVFCTEINSDLPTCDFVTNEKWNTIIINAYRREVKVKNTYNIEIPMTVANEKVGTMLMTRRYCTFNDEELALAEFGATVAGIEIQTTMTLESEAKLRRARKVINAIGTLTYSENQAIKRILEGLKSMEGNLIISEIAYDTKIARAVFVNAIRKLECAGVIETKSLGMKGTFIRVVDKNIFDTLQSRSKKLFDDNV